MTCPLPEVGWFRPGSPLGFTAIDRAVVPAVAFRHGARPRAVSSRPRGAAARTAGAVDEGHGRAVKRSVSLDPDLDRELTQRFGRGGKSRFLNEAARDALAPLRIQE